ncbi:SDR family NAD(P)-dependent oxidoreductase [Rhodococcus sp. G-MC3]|uniref:type I polyketide synthase n=1 Tax=Rhodococcus sp. G-MC3 TaxID=3046209 RepID=UPI0024BB7198|nr:type I polyketide synthase [Rhodococcus sp. G-MC3]MDJ0394204.1 SDR family NAD(P)-dependent oxidoreductase [Rhodococcus sp. G-MC3]
MTAESTTGSDIFEDRRLARNPIAIVGMSGLFPKATSHREYWQNIVDGVDCTEEVPASRWSLDDYFDADRTAPDKTYSRRGAFLPDVDFDPLEFGMPPNQLEVTSTMQTLSLGVARDLLIDAGATGRTESGRDVTYSSWYDPVRTGVVLGTTGPVPLMHPLAARLSTPILKEAARSCGLSTEDVNAIADKFTAAFAPWEENSFPGLLANVVAGRVANRFGLGGINCTVDAACAASLAALRTAVAELLDGRADTMITGGVDTENSIFIYLCFSKVGALSPTGQISPFSASADGTLLGEGISMVALRRLSDAQRDGNRIYAVIRGLGSSSDGRSKSIYAPRAEGQRIALDRAYTDAECSPASVELFEAHATGTAVGDRTEIEALNGLLRDAGDETSYAAVGSVKSQIGHTKGAAGTASLMKLALGLYHKVLPGTINVEKPNPGIGTDAALYVNTATRPWIRDPQRPVRRAAVSAMGFGGTNFHVVLEESDAPRADVRPLHCTPRVHVWHATDVDALIEAVRSGESMGGGEIPADHARLGFVALDDEDEAQLRELSVEQLTRNRDSEQWSHPEGLFFRAAAMPEIKVGALFAGQGSQYVDMGTDALLNTPPVAEAFDLANAAFMDATERLGRIVFPPPVFDDAARDRHDTMLRRTEFAQPAIGALSVGQYQFFRELGFEADALAGHSFGELTALWASGAVETGDYFTLARARGAAMAPTSDGDNGTMLAVAASREDVDAIVADIDDAWICNHNAPDQVVVGGGRGAIDTVVSRAAERGVATRELPVSAAFHTPYVAHAVDAFAPTVEAVGIGTPSIPIYANSPDRQYGSDRAENAATLVGQLLKPVEFVASLEAMRADGCTVFVEFGPKKVLTSLVHRTLGDDVVAIATDIGPLGNSDLSLKRAAAQLIVLGVTLDNVNRYASTPAPASTGSGMTVSLSAPEYVPPTRRKAYADALADGYRVSALAPTDTSSVPAASTAAEVTVPAAPVQPPPAPQATRPSETTVPHNDSPPATYESSPSTAHLDTHDRYLDGQLELARHLAEALSADRIDDGLIRAIEAVKDHGVAISHSHTRATEVLGRIAELEIAGSVSGSESIRPVTTTRSTRVAAQQVAPEPAPAAIAPTAPAVTAPTAPEPVAQIPTVVSVSEEAAGVSADQLRRALLEVVADKTGYPVEMVDPSMDLEADLGVDSIKRVQVLGAVQERFPSLPSLGPEQLGTLRTLDQIVDLLAQSTTEPSALESVAPPGPLKPSISEVSADALRTALLEVVADKTGYPVEMVDPSMDLEADLGIDSIKRVQVLGAVQERFPSLPSLGPEQLGTLRTLDQIVELLAAGSDVHPKAEAAATSPRHTVDLAALPPVDRIDGLFGTDSSAIVLDLTDDGADAACITSELSNRGWSVEQVSATGTVNDIERAVAAVFDTDVSLALVVAGASSGWSVASERLTATLLAAKYASVSLERAEGLRRAFVTLTRLDGALGFAGTVDPVCALIGGVGGVVKTLAAEQPGLFCRALDVHPAVGADSLVETLLIEISDAATDTLEVGIGANGDRWTIVPSLHGASSSNTVVDPSVTMGATELTESDVVLVTGGARGVTALCARELGRHTAARFVLLGRTDPDPEPAWAQGVGDSGLQSAALTAMAGSGATPRDVGRACAAIRAGREIAVTLDDLGDRAQYVAVDVTDTDAVRAGLSALASEITVVVHGAGVLADSAIGAKTVADITGVLEPKITGLGAVLDALDSNHGPLRRIVLFTSVSGLYGNSGQADYAAANEALTRFAAAHVSSRPNLHVTAIDWGAWDGGMVTAQLREHFLGRGVTLLEPGVGARAFAEQFTHDRRDDVVILVGEAASLTDGTPALGEPFVAIRRLTTLDTNPLVQAHRIGSHPVLPATFGLGAMINVVERAYPGRCVVAVRDFHVHKGIVFDHPIESMDIRVAPDNDRTVRVFVTGGDTAKTVSHYVATMDLGRHPAQAPRLSAPRLGGGVPADELYRDARQFHAPLLHGMRRVLADSDNELVLQCELGGEPFELGAYAGVLHNPVLADVVLQGPPVLGHRLLNSACLPLGVGRIDYYAPLPMGEPWAVVVDNPRVGAVDVTIDATAIGADGTVLQKFSDVTVVTTPDLSDMFRESVRQWSQS